MVTKSSIDCMCFCHQEWPQEHPCSNCTHQHKNELEPALQIVHLDRCKHCFLLKAAHVPGDGGHDFVPLDDSNEGGLVGGCYGGIKHIWDPSGRCNRCRMPRKYSVDDHADTFRNVSTEDIKHRTHLDDIEQLHTEIKKLKDILHWAGTTPLTEIATEVAALKENVAAMAISINEKDKELIELRRKLSVLEELRNKLSLEQIDKRETYNGYTYIQCKRCNSSAPTIDRLEHYSHCPTALARNAK